MAELSNGQTSLGADRPGDARMVKLACPSREWRGDAAGTGVHRPLAALDECCRIYAWHRPAWRSRLSLAPCRSASVEAPSTHLARGWVDGVLAAGGSGEADPVCAVFLDCPLCP